MTFTNLISFGLFQNILLNASVFRVSTAKSIIENNWEICFGRERKRSTLAFLLVFIRILFYRTNESTKLTILLTSHLLVEAHLHQIFTDLEVLFCSPAHGQTSKCFFWSPGHAVAKYSQKNNNKTLGNGLNCNYADLLDCLLEERYERTSLIADLE